jgi:hypothetical protein
VNLVFERPLLGYYWEVGVRISLPLHCEAARTEFERGDGGQGGAVYEDRTLNQRNREVGWGELVALRDRLSNPLIVELTAFESLRTAVG